MHSRVWLLTGRNGEDWRTEVVWYTKMIQSIQNNSWMEISPCNMYKWQNCLLRRWISMWIWEQSHSYITEKFSRTGFEDHSIAPFFLCLGLGCTLIELLSIAWIAMHFSGCVTMEIFLDLFIMAYCTEALKLENNSLFWISQNGKSRKGKIFAVAHFQGILLWLIR